MNKPKPLIICGPTASGKSGLAIKIAKLMNTEIVSADSMQIYKFMNIGTAKVTDFEADCVKHYLIDFVDPKSTFSVAEYCILAKNLISSLQYSGKLPIIVGGTGLYVNSLIYNYDFANTNKNEEIRLKYKQILLDNGPEYLHNLLSSKNPVKANSLNMNDTKRVIRALEIEEMGGLPTVSNIDYDRYNVVGLNFEREALYEKINKRVDQMFENGLVEEIKELLFEKNLDFDMQSMKAIGYKEFKDYFDGYISIDEVKELIKKNTRNYAKRQTTWFKKTSGIVWFDDNNKALEHIKKLYL